VNAHVIYWNSWDLTDAANLRFRRIRRNVSVPLLVFVVAIALVQIETAPPKEIPETVMHYAEILPPPIPPPPPKPQEVAVVEPMSKPTPVPVAKPVPVPHPEVTQAQKVEAARSRAANAGAMEIAKQLMALQSSMNAERVTNGQVVIGSTSAAPRSIATSLTREGHGSGGIDTGALSKGVGGAELSGRSTAKVVAASGGGGGAASGAGKGKGSRDREEIEEVFDKNKGAIYALYNRALRDNPVLQGKVVLRLTILPDGTVSDCQIASSDLKDPDLESKLIARVKMFRFLAKDIGAVTTTKPIDFYPAA